MGILDTTDVWADAGATPHVLASTLARGRDDRAEGARTLRSARRIIATGNGASFHAAHAFATAALLTSSPAPDVLALPAGILSVGAFSWRPGDVLVAFSSSGELRDLADALEELPSGVPSALVTARPDSTLSALVDGVILVAAGPSSAVTHTHQYCGAVLAILATWAQAVNDAELLRACETAPVEVSSALKAARQWHAEVVTRIATPDVVFVAGSGNAWSAAMQAALLVKEIARIPCEPVETREVATTTMTAMAPGHLLMTQAGGTDMTLAESEAIAASRGATVVRAPDFRGSVDPRLASLVHFPSGLALAIEFAVRRGLDPDHPDWESTYFATARRGGPTESDLSQQTRPALSGPMAGDLR